VRSLVSGPKRRPLGNVAGQHHPRVWPHLPLPTPGLSLPVRARESPLESALEPGSGNSAAGPTDATATNKPRKNANARWREPGNCAGSPPRSGGSAPKARPTRKKSFETRTARKAGREYWLTERKPWANRFTKSASKNSSKSDGASHKEWGIRVSARRGSTGGHYEPTRGRADFQLLPSGRGGDFGSDGFREPALRRKRIRCRAVLVYATKQASRLVKARLVGDR
jgi:hypothetical protein